MSSILVISTLALVEMGTGWASHRSSTVDKLVNGLPLLIVDNGRLLEDRLDRARLTPDDLLEAGRQHHGLERLDQIRYAVLERDGAISVIPARPGDE